MSQEQESAGPSAHEPSQHDYINENHTDSDEAEDIYASVDCINNDYDISDPQVKLVTIAGTAQNLT